MNEIEKMFNRVGLLGIAEQNPSTGEIIGCKPMPFTAEKQLNIIKFLGKTRDFHTCGKYCTALNSEGDSVESLQDDFEESLAGLMNLLWQNLTEKEKQQIKEILE